MAVSRLSDFYKPAVLATHTVFFRTPKNPECGQDECHRGRLRPV
jgi:hypothetical protein